MSNTQSIDQKIDLAKIETLLATRWLGRAKNELWETIDSTNNRAIELARSGSAQGTMILASQQSAGRGRSGNTWLSPANSGLYMSFIVRPKLAVTNLPVITLITGVAVVQAIQSCLGIKVGLKWVNDLIADGKKIGGILAEYQKQAIVNENEKHIAGSGALIIGIGLNLYKPETDLPPDTEKKMGFLDSSLVVDHKSIDKNQLVAFIANELEMAIEKMELDEVPSLLNSWRAYSITLGEEIVANVGDKQIKGLALDITDNGELIIKTQAGNITLSAGEVSIRKPGGTYI